MKSTRISVLSIALFASLMIGDRIAEAQSDTAHTRVRAAIVQSTAASEKSIEVELNSSVLTIQFVNSTMNGSTHQGYVDDAQAAASASILVLREEPEYATLISVRVNYIKRNASPQSDKILDSVEFRKNANGEFVFHGT